MPERVPDGPVHDHFGLSYASYLVMNRTVLQSMPIEWQERFVGCMAEVEQAFGHLDFPPYEVRVRHRDGRYGRDPIPNYNRGRTRLQPAPPARECPECDENGEVEDVDDYSNRGPCPLCKGTGIDATSGRQGGRDA